MTYSSYQEAIFDWVENGSGNLIVQACAGSGKTFSLLHSILRMKGSVISLAFNRKNALELQEKIAQRGLVHAEGATMHAIGFRTYRKHRPNVKLNNSKVWSIVENYTVEKEYWTAKNFICKLVSFAKQYGIGIKEISTIDDNTVWERIIATQDLPMDMEIELEEAMDIAKKVLIDSNREQKEIDFDDMIYLPLFYGMTYQKYDWVLLDEAQDTNVVRKLMLEKLMHENSRLIMVGDRKQAIYMFAGAENNSMDILLEQFSCVELPLSVCYRCGQSIIRDAQKYSDQIQAWENSPEGIVRHEKYDEFLNNAENYGLTKADGIICRNNAPLVSLAFGLIRKGIGCRIEGRDIGKNLLTLCNKWKKVTDLNKFTEKLVEFFDKQMDKCKSKAALQVLEDKMQTMIILIERVQSLGKNDVKSLSDLINSMFSDSDEKNVPNVVVLSSVHKAKGLEWKRCFLLGKDQFMPSKYAITPDALEQEENLIYIAITRAMEELVYINDVPTRRELNA